jgi:hypothetical protein
MRSPPHDEPAEKYRSHIADKAEDLHSIHAKLRTDPGALTENSDWRTTATPTSLTGMMK